jgi:hypothetical protein
MNRFFKTLLFWLLVAMLPYHAVAGAMPMSCDPVHHHALPRLMQDDAQHQHHQHHGQQDDGMAQHGHHHDLAQMDDAAADDGMADGSSSGAHAHAGCSACAAGCVGAAGPPFALNSTLAFGGSEAVFISPSPLVTGYTPAGLDRPPRDILA